MNPVSDLVRISKLETQFLSDPQYIQHTVHISRTVRKTEKWKRERVLGRGGSGIIWLDRCVQGDSKGEVRAVKKIQKLEDGNYSRELEAIALFSHPKFSQPKASLLPLLD